MTRFFLGGSCVTHVKSTWRKNGGQKRLTVTRWFHCFLLIFTSIWGRFPIWRAYFSNRLKLYNITSSCLNLHKTCYMFHKKDGHSSKSLTLQRSDPPMKPPEKFDDSFWKKSQSWKRKIKHPIPKSRSFPDTPGVATIFWNARCLGPLGHGVGHGFQFGFPWDFGHLSPMFKGVGELSFVCEVEEIGTYWPLEKNLENQHIPWKLMVGK